jgi:hypothetical protein
MPRGLEVTATKSIGRGAKNPLGIGKITEKQELTGFTNV